MAVEPKKPDKPGYMSTEFYAVIGMIGYSLLDRLGVQPDQIPELAENWVQSLANLISGNGNVKFVVIGFLVWAYGQWRTSIKRTKIIAETKKVR